MIEQQNGRSVIRQILSKANVCSSAERVSPVRQSTSRLGRETRAGWRGVSPVGLPSRPCDPGWAARRARSVSAGHSRSPVGRPACLLIAAHVQTSAGRPTRELSRRDGSPRTRRDRAGGGFGVGSTGSAPQAKPFGSQKRSFPVHGTWRSIVFTFSVTGMK